MRLRPRRSAFAGGARSGRRRSLRAAGLVAAAGLLAGAGSPSPTPRATLNNGTTVNDGTTLNNGITVDGGTTVDAGTVDRTIRDPAIGEASGLAISPTHPGLLWTVNDSGNPPVLFGVAADGRTVARVRVSGVANVDWEAVAAFRDGAGRALLAAADIGDNRAVRAGVEIDIVPEPARLGSSTQAPSRRLTLTYPDGPHDAETLLVDPRDRRLFIVTKGFDATVYAVPREVWPGAAADAPATASATLELVATASIFFATDGAILPSGQVLLRTYGSVAIFEPIMAPTPGGGLKAGTGVGRAPSLRELAVATLPRQTQGRQWRPTPPAGCSIWPARG